MLIIFDLDDTLIDTSRYLTPIVFKNTIKELISNGLQIDEDWAIKTIFQIDKKSISSTESIKKFLSDILAKKIFFDIAFKAMTSQKNEIKIFTLKNAKSTLRYLSKAHKLAIVTKGDVKFQFEKIKKAGIDTSLFSKIVVTKKSKQLEYKRIMKDLGYESLDTFVCGDRVDYDLKPAKKIGCRTIHMKWGRGKKIFKNEDTKVVDYTIYSLEEILKILDTTIEVKNADK